jgi:hypothetical protein
MGSLDLFEGLRSTAGRDIAAKLLAAVLDQPRVKRLLSNELLSVDGTLVAAWASAKSFMPKDGGAAAGEAGALRSLQPDRLEVGEEEQQRRELLTRP